MICICEPNPIIFLRISFLNPVTVETAMIITARLNAIPVTDILIMGPENDDRASLLKVSLVAMNNPVLKDDLAIGLKDIK